MKDDCVITVNVGATWTIIALVGRDGKIHCYWKVATPQLGFLPLIDKALDVVKNTDCCIHAVILGVPGPVDYARNNVVKLPNLLHWNIKELSETVRELSEPLWLIANDTDIAVLGEYQFGAGRNVENLVFASCGSGVGAGVILGGQLIVGQYSLGEVGHTIIDLGSRQTVEQLGSGIALERSIGKAVTATTDSDVVGPTDCESDPIVRVSAAFALCVRSLALCFMPDRIIVGGGCAHAHPEVLAAARDEIGRIGDIQPLKPEDVIESELGDNAGIIGGYPYWLQTISKDISTSTATETESQPYRNPGEAP